MYSVEGNPDSDIIDEWYVSMWNWTSYTGEWEAVGCDGNERNIHNKHCFSNKAGGDSKKRKGQTSQLSDANTDMSKLLTEVTTGGTTVASKAAQKRIIIYLFFLPDDKLLHGHVQDSNICAAKKKLGYIYLNFQVASKSLKKR